MKQFNKSVKKTEKVSEKKAQERDRANIGNICNNIIVKLMSCLIIPVAIYIVHTRKNKNKKQQTAHTEQ